MAAALQVFGKRTLKRRSIRRSAASLIELLVVLFIIGVMLSLLLPALSGARNRANTTKCLNNMRQVHFALRRSIDVTRKFPVPNRWTIDILRWMEETSLYDKLKNNQDPSAEFPRPVLLTCPFQADFPSRVPTVGFCHFILTVDRPIRGRPEKARWEIHDRPRLVEDQDELPWFISPEQNFAEQREMFAKQPGPHPADMYMTPRGEFSP